MAALRCYGSAIFRRQAGSQVGYPESGHQDDGGTEIVCKMVNKDPFTVNPKRLLLTVRGHLISHAPVYPFGK